MYYVLTDMTTHEVVAIFLTSLYPYNIPNVSVHAFSGVVFDLSLKVWDADLDDFVNRTDIVLSKLSFLTRFTVQERVAIRSSTDPIVVDFLRMLDVAENIVLTDTNTVQGINYLVYVNLLTADRATAILTP